MKIIGHRGAMGFAPENTLLSFSKAMESGVDAIELDVYKCKSGEIVCFHDDQLERTTNGKGYIFDKTLSELKKLDAGEGQKIPTLNEVLELIDNRKIVNIELKGDNTLFDVAKIIENNIKNGWDIKNLSVSSFNHHYIKEIKNLIPNLHTGALIEAIPIDYSDCAIKALANSINISKDFINQNFVEHAHKNKLEVYVYTVNSSVDKVRMQELNVDGIFTNIP